MADTSKITLKQLKDAMNKAKNYTDNEIAGVTGVSTVEPEALDMPKVFFYGNALPTTKDNVNLTMEYISNTAKFRSFVKLKCQGNSSMSYAKKNFTINMYSDEARATKLKKDFKGWGAQSKFCLKANYVDSTHTRNISGARIAYDMVQSRPDSPFKRQLSQCPRNGAVDGFPIKLYFNGEFYGIYTWNIPKDGWMFNMDKSNPNHVVLCAERNTDGNSSLINSCQFRKLWTDGDGGDWSVEFGTYSTDMVASFNRCINFVMTATDQEFHDNIGEYFDLYSLLDYYCFSYLTCHLDGLAKNMLMATYDGVIWGACLYDMDSIYGVSWNGNSYVATNYQCPEQYQEQFSGLWPRIERCFSAELYVRYLELRQGALSLSNIIKHVEEIYDVIPDRVFADEKAKWTSLPQVNTNTMTRFRNYMRDRAVYVDSQMQEIGTRVPCTGIVLSADTLSFTTTDTQTLSVVVSPDNCTEAITWSVSPTGIATVNNGVITPISNGECTITVTCGSYSDTCSVTVSLPVVECTGITLDKTELNLGVLAGGSGNIDEQDDSQVNYLDGAVWKDGQYKVSGFYENGTNKVASVTVPYAGVYKFTGTTSANISYKGLGKVDETGKIIGLYNEIAAASGTSEVYLTVTEPNTILGASFYPNGNEITDDIYNSLSLKRVMTTKNVQKDVQLDISKAGKPGWSTTTDCNIIEINTSGIIDYKYIFAIKVADKIFEYPLNYTMFNGVGSSFKDTQIVEASQINAFATNGQYIEFGLPTDTFGTTENSFKEYMTTNSKTIVINPSEYFNNSSAGVITKVQLIATVTPSNCTQSVVWSVSPQGIVRVNNGLVTAVANGEATVTATCGSQSANCAVTVSGMSEYTDISYIESTGTQYINTRIVPTASTKIELVAEMSASERYDHIFGSDNFMKAQWMDETGTGIYATKKNGQNQITGLTLGKHTYVMDMTDTANVITIDGTKYGVIIGQVASTTNPLLLLCGYKIDGSVETEFCGIGKIYSCKIYHEDTLVANMKPILTNSGTYGLLDTVNNTFYASEVGSFTGGNTPSGGDSDVDSNYLANASWQVGTLDITNNATVSGSVNTGSTEDRYTSVQIPAGKYALRSSNATWKKFRLSDSNGNVLYYYGGENTSYDIIIDTTISDDTIFTLEVSYYRPNDTIEVPSLMITDRTNITTITLDGSLTYGIPVWDINPSGQNGQVNVEYAVSGLTSMPMSYKLEGYTYNNELNNAESIGLAKQYNLGYWNGSVYLRFTLDMAETGVTNDVESITNYLSNHPLTFKYVR